jgi:signal transduction histidine kinase/ligand-binding sensor domain-containing protein
MAALPVLLAPRGAAYGQALAEPNRIELFVPDVAVQQWGVEQGLPQGTVAKLIVDRNGHVWGTTFGGLIRFDGRRVETYGYRRVPVMIDNAATALLAEDDGSIWFGTPSGTIGRLLNGQLVDTLPQFAGGIGKPVQDLYRLDDGSLVVRIGDRIRRFRAGRWVEDGNPPTAHSPLFQRSAHSVVYATVDGVAELSARGARTIASGGDASYAFDRRVHVDRRGRIWLGDRRGLSLVVDGRLTRVAGVDSIVRMIASNPRDSVDVIWVGAGRTLFRLRTDRSGGAQPVAERVLTSTAAPLTLAFSDDGVMVLGTLGRGLFTLRANVTRVEEIPTRQANPEASHMVGDGAGRLWATPGCGDAHLITLSGAVLDSVMLRRGQGCITALAFDDQRRLWTGYSGGIRRTDANRVVVEWQFSRADDAAAMDSAATPPPKARPLLQRGRTMLVGLTDGRIGAIGPDDRWVYLPGWEKRTGRQIESFALERDNSLWVGQAGRITHSTDTLHTVYTSNDGIPESIPRVMHPDRRGGLWIGTYGSGLNHFVPGKGSRVVPLPDETVSAFVVDRGGLVWMPGNRGLTVMPIRRLAEWARDSSLVPEARLLMLADGVPEGNSGYPAGAVIDSTHLAFGSISGVVLADVSLLPSPTSSAVVLIDRIVAPLRSVETLSDVRLGSDERTVIVEYTMPVYRFAEAVQFRYRLDGRDDGWISVGAARRLQLAALPPGRLTLRLQGRAPGGNWQEAEPLVINVTPLWHERTSVRVLGVVLILVVLYAISAQRARTVRVRNEAMESSMNARREAAELSVRHQRELAQVGRLAVAGELTASLSHELGQPLAAMVNNAEVARRLLARRDARSVVAASGDRDRVRGRDDLASIGTEVDDMDEIDEILHDVVRQGQRASQVVREFRRFLQHGQGEREQIRVQDLLESVVRLVRHEFADAGVELTTRVAPLTPTLSAERVLLQQVLVNLLQNALEASRGTPVRRVLMRARPARGGLRISVADSGLGFAPDLRNRAFEPFVTSRSAGMGMGLAIARRLIEAHGGSIAVGKVPSGGAVVSCWLPASSVTGAAAGSNASVRGTLPYV